MATSLVCDGCGRAASAEHIAERIARLEWATRFRPIHIQALFVMEAPGKSREEDCTALLDALNISAAEGGAPEDALAARLSEFQRRGFYLAYLMECPLEAQDLAAGNGKDSLRSGSADLCERFGPTFVKRVQYSYKPKQIVLLSAAMRPLVPVLQKAGLGDRLVLEQGAPLELPQTGKGKPRNFQEIWERLQAPGPAAV